MCLYMQIIARMRSIGVLMSRYQITAPNVRKRLVSYSFHGEGVMYQFRRVSRIDDRGKFC